MLTPQQLIDACRATHQPLPSGRMIAEVVERLNRVALAAAAACQCNTRALGHHPPSVDEIDAVWSEMYAAVGALHPTSKEAS